MARGRKTSFKKEYIDLAYKFALLGATDKQMAEFFETSEVTFNAWKKEQPEFLKSLKRGKIQADANVSKALYHRALGYSHKEDKIFNHNGKPLVIPTIKHYPPDAVAAIFWLKNRKPNEWREKQEIEHSGDLLTPLRIVKASDYINDNK